MQELKTAEDRYGYDISDEKVLMRFSNRESIVIGTITQSFAGFENLNTTTMLFADIDIGNPQVQEGCLIDSEAPAIAALKEVVHFSCVFPDRKPFYFPGFFKRLFGLGFDAKISTALYFDIAFKEDIGFRVYRTKNGLRVMCATHEFLPCKSDGLMRFIYSDPRYRRLCKKQDVFRARTTPKLWRLVAGREDEARVCDYVETIGNTSILPEFDRMVAYHDSATGVFKKGGYLA